MKLRLGLVAIIAALIAAPLAYAAGYFPGFPIVGGASYCNGFATGVGGQVCVSTVPAGPTALTGSEIIPADTQLSQGQSPQTVSIPVAVLGAGPHQYAAPLTGATLTMTAAQRRLIIEPAGTIAALTVVLPAATGLYNNQVIGFCSTQVITALTVTAGTGTSVLNAPSAMTVPSATGSASCPEWIYRVQNTTWYRIQ